LLKGALAEIKGAFFMIELVLTVCVLAQPATCRDQRLLFDSDHTLLQCMMSAPPFIAQWGEQHPQWFVQRWQCRYPRKDEKDI
jgi:hypothetical protein